MANKSPCQLVSRQLVYLLKKLSTCTIENPHIINSIYFRSIIKENNFNGKD